MGMLDKKVVVIGSGIGGAGCAALLAKEGLDVTLFERNAFPGGKAASFEKDGFIYDTGVHAVGNGEKGPLGEINRIVGGELKFNVIPSGNRIIIGDGEALLPLQYSSDEAIMEILEGIGVDSAKRGDCFRCFKELAAEKSPEDMAVLDEMPLKDFIDRYTDDSRFHQMINATCALLLVLTYYQGSAGEFIHCFSEAAKNGSLSYPVGGMGAVARSYLDAFERMGGNLIFNTSVESIVVQDRKVTGVALADGEEVVPADVVISNAGLQPTVEMVCEHLDENYKSWALSLKSSYGAVSVKYALNAKLIEYPLTLWIPDVRDKNMFDKYVGVFYPVPSNMDAGLAPGGCQLVLAGAVTLPDPENRELCESILSKIESTMAMLHPDIEKNVIWKIKTDVAYIARISGRKLGEVIGLAQDYRQVGKNRPNPRLPVSGLYVVGADAGGRGIGTEMAGDSALNVSKMVISDQEKN